VSRYVFAHQGREDDDVNVLCLGARIIGRALAAEIVDTFLKARSSGIDRHKRRVDKIEAIEKQYSAPAASSSGKK
jgi:ribose 5-phosphate isomerase B